MYIYVYRYVYLYIYIIVKCLLCRNCQMLRMSHIFPDMSLESVIVHGISLVEPWISTRSVRLKRRARKARPKTDAAMLCVSPGVTLVNLQGMSLCLS